MELTGEYVGCDGEPRRLRVSCEASGDANPLQSLSAGVARMKELVAEFFGPLVERDAPGATVDPEDAVDGSNVEVAILCRDGYFACRVCMSEHHFSVF
ncbi:EKC/KEOPS complex subunit GON7 isoform X2 [Arvicola amphibius]|uniref:EKC/KEOPS complex subunit GON7 isoform X2 n=1 Tax=Arvicola amphibius TaxID=1047088 RepID=UPI0018E3F4A7|nr:EKC/KEOPS complex subunit GON7 isoform X2 [Arvicola amphibius]